MIIKLKLHSSKPIYEQLILELKRGIIAGELAPGTPLPSARSLAGDLGVNIHTVNKVYKYLQSEKILMKQKNSFIVNPAEALEPSPTALEAFMEKVDELMVEKNLYHISDERLLTILKQKQQELNLLTKEEISYG